jgi:hypothetical protein
MIIGSRNGNHRAIRSNSHIPINAKGISMRKHLFPAVIVLVSILLMACGGTAVTGNNSSFSNKWRIEVSEGAKSTGELVFRISPQGQSSMDVSIGIVEGARENKIAAVIRDGFRAQLPEDAYKIERDDGEDVLIKRRGDTPRFAVVLISSTVKSVRIRLDKE